MSQFFKLVDPTIPLFPATSWQKQYPVPPDFIDRRMPTTEYLDGRNGPVPDCDRQASLQDLSGMMRWPGMRSPVLKELKTLIKDAQFSPKQPIRLLEVGCGTGELGRWVATRLARSGFSVDLMLSDLRTDHILPTPPEIARHPQIRESQVACDLLRDSLPLHDISVMHFALHHFSDAQIDAVMRRLVGGASVGGVFSDLELHPLSFYFVRAFFPFLMQSPVTVADGMLSVQQAFSRRDWEERRNFVLSAGADHAVSRPYFPFRLLLRWRKEFSHEP